MALFHVGEGTWPVNGKRVRVLSISVDSDALEAALVAAQLAQGPVTAHVPFEIRFDVNDVALMPVRTRVVSRQSCLWRHSFDWRNRKRGHPVHRS